MKLNLTQKFVDAIKPTNKDTNYQDAHTKGLTLRVRTSGMKSWVVRYRWEGFEKVVTYRGGADEVSLMSARQWAGSVRVDVARGQPSHLGLAKNPARTSFKTMDELAADVMAHLTNMGRSDKYLGECKRYFDKVILPQIGTMEVRKVTKTDLRRVLTGLGKKKTTANRVMALLSRTFGLAAEWEIAAIDIARDLEKHSETPRERYYRDEELDRLFSVLKDTVSDNAIRLLFYTGARPAEVFSAKWNEFALDDAQWRKPAHKVKNRRVHVVPLSDEAVELLTRMKADSSSEYAFPARTGSKTPHLSSIKNRWKKICEEAQLEDANIYDLRKTFATRLLSQGANVKTVASLTGHRDAATLLKHYTQVVNDDQRKALEGLRRKPAV